jgi:hypothetical protein
MHHIDLAGFTTPSGDPVDASWFRILRGDGTQGLIERAVFEVPAGEGCTVSDLRIGGVPITTGAQIAEHIVVNIVGRATGIGVFHNTAIPCSHGACQDNEQPNYLAYRQLSDSCTPTGRSAFGYPGATPAGVPPAPSALAGEPPVTALPPRPGRRAHRRLTRSV